MTMLVVTLVGTIVFMIFALPSVPLHYLNSPAIWFFVLAGIFSPALVRWIYLISLERIGASISSSILATGPAFTGVIAVIFLKEQVTLPLALGIIAIICGIIFFERHYSSDIRPQNRRKRDLLLPLLAALFFSLAVVLRKKGLLILDSPLLGVTIGFATSLLVYLAMLLFSADMRRNVSIALKDLPRLVGTGVFMTAAWFCIFKALSTGDAIVVTPLASLHPLVVVGLSSVFLKEQNEVSSRIILGAVLVVAGVVLITIDQAR
jgi:drug/metabolite transporter (DMT)-like permease